MFYTNIGLLSSGSHGKSTLVKALYQYCHTLKRIGFPFHSDNDLVSQELMEGGVPMVYSEIRIEDGQVNFFEIPAGISDSQTCYALSRMDAAILLVPSNAILDTETKRLWKLIQTMELRGAIFVNAIDNGLQSISDTFIELKDSLCGNLLAMNDPNEDAYTTFLKDSPDLLVEAISCGDKTAVVFGSAQCSIGLYALLTVIACMPVRHI